MNDSMTQAASVGFTGMLATLWTWFTSFQQSSIPHLQWITLVVGIGVGVATGTNMVYGIWIKFSERRNIRNDSKS